MEQAGRWQRCGQRAQGLIILLKPRRGRPHAGRAAVVMPGELVRSNTVAGGVAAPSVCACGYRTCSTPRRRWLRPRWPCRVDGQWAWFASLVAATARQSPCSCAAVALLLTLARSIALNCPP